MKTKMTLGQWHVEVIEAMGQHGIYQDDELDEGVMAWDVREQILASPAPKRAAVLANLERLDSRQARAYLAAIAR